MNHLTITDLHLIQAFASDANKNIHLYGNAQVVNREGVCIGTLPINSSEEQSNDYFLSGESIAGYAYDRINFITLVKGKATLTIDYILPSK